MIFFAGYGNIKSQEQLRSLCEKNAKNCSKEKSSNNNEQLPCKGNEIMTEAYNDCKKGDLNNSLLQTGDSTNQDDVPIPVQEETVLRKKQL